MVAVAAPAFAASCPTGSGQAALTLDTKPTTLTFPPSPVTATVSITRSNPNTVGFTGVVFAPSYDPDTNYIRLQHDAGMKKGDSIVFTLTFSQPVKNLTFKITDIDMDTGQWIDHIVINTPNYVSTPAPEVIGNGTVANPFRSSFDGNFNSSRGDLTLTWPGSLSQVRLTYLAMDDVNASSIGQHIGIGNIGFSC